jgi:D-threo-aldose 1-dehydrogenase
MIPGQKKRFGRVDLEVTTFAFGTAPSGNFLQPISESETHTMIETAWEAGVRLYDTAPMYGHGLAELRTGHNLRWKPRDEYVLASKVGRLLKPAKRETIDFTPWVDAAPFNVHFDYSYDGTMRAFEDSLQRLGLERMDMCFIHDIDQFTRGDEQPEVFRQAMDGCWRALEKLRNERVVKRCWNKKRSMLSCRSARSGASRCSSVAALTPASLRRARARARNTTTRRRPRR